ncbi:DUF4397 domain-containing protein [Nocardioides panacis]|uniref:DUF4397 domain-containing protein n=1 Tax=Nocardioides panacis TaxID=2849501 RepID=A0A975SVV2_9ACTN|nr:DUF4397 domain-containing protein [Nocardioides panacis]QWZ06872.1 DUF4397 domain-containing protein [Nocardioides panacis]
MRIGSVIVAGGLACAGLVVGPLPSGAAGGAPGSVQVVQAVPGEVVAVHVDGRAVRGRVPEGTIVPLTLRAGRHVVAFTPVGGGETRRTSVRVLAGGSVDVVLHRPAAVAGLPVVSSYRTPRRSIGPGKARVLVAHTATVAPADVRVDGRTIFTNIANGEFAEADVPAGTHRVALYATGRTTDPLLGPISVDLAPATVTMVYAVGRPSNGSMKVIAHTAQVQPDGTVAPHAIAAGEAGLAADVPVRPFGPAVLPLGG